MSIDSGLFNLLRFNMYGILKQKGTHMSGLLYPKPTVKKKSKYTYYNSTIRIKDKPKNKTVKARTVRQKRKYQKAYKPMYPYWSIFTDDLKTCYISKRVDSVEIHHIFGGSRKHLSEKYGFILPLTSDWHTQAPYAIHRDRELDLYYKKKCQEYWINVLHKTKEEWIEEFEKWWV